MRFSAQAATPQTPSATMARPIPTMMRKAQKVIHTGGRSSFGKAFRPCNSALASPATNHEPMPGMPIAAWVVSACSSGQPNSSVGCCLRVSHQPSIAATLAGWYSWATLPLSWPATIWSGATIAIISTPIRSAVPPSATAFFVSSVKAEAPATTIAVVR